MVKGHRKSMLAEYVDSLSWRVSERGVVGGGAFGLEAFTWRQRELRCTARVCNRRACFKNTLFRVVYRSEVCHVTIVYHVYICYVMAMTSELHLTLGLFGCSLVISPTAT